MENTTWFVRVMLRFFRWFAKPYLKDYIEGDLVQTYNENLHKFSRFHASLLLAIEVILLIRPSIIGKRSFQQHTSLTSKAMIKNYFLISWRTIIRHPSTSIINVLGLSLGIAACILIFLLTSFELDYDKFHSDKDRIYRIAGRGQNMEGNEFKTGCVPVPTGSQLRKELTGFETVAGFFVYDANVRIQTTGTKVKEFTQPKSEIDNNIIIAEPEYFDLFRYQWLAGNPSSALKEPFKVVLSEKEALRYFDNIPLQDIPGKQVIYNDSLVLTVSGIVKDWAKNSDFDFKDFISWSTIENSFLKNSIKLQGWSNWDINNQVFVKLNKNSNTAQLKPRLTKFSNSHLKPDVIKAQLLLQPISDIHFDATIGDEYSRKASLPVLYGLIGIAGFILVIAAINFINMSTAQSAQRSREIGIRKVLGSSKGTLAIRFLSETFLLTLVASLLAILFVNPFIKLMASFLPPGLRLDFLSPSLWIFVGAMIGITAILAGFYPAKILSSFKPVIVLKGQKGPAYGQHNWLRKSLIIFQFTVSLLFIIGTLIIGNQIHYMLNKNLGFNKEAIITIQTNAKEIASKRDFLVEQVKRLPGISGVSISGKPATATGQNGTVMIYNGQQRKEIEVFNLMADDQFLSLYHIPLVAGRNYDHSDTIRQLLINETAAKKLGFKTSQDAIGQSVFIGMSDQPNSEQVFPIVGVVANFHLLSLHDSIGSLFMASSSAFSHVLNIKLSTANGTGQVKNTIESIEKLWKDAYPDKPFEFSFLDESIAAFYESEQKTEQIINGCMFTAIFISCMGLFGLISFVTEQRRKEIGVRKVLGASVSQITVLLCRDFVLLIIVAVVIASPVAWYFMQKWLNGFPYRITIQPWTFIVAGLSAITIALATISIQSIKAAVANPVKALRTE
ncbi:MAG: ABC transporter permease [Chitinophagaceae bacterium]